DAQFSEEPDPVGAPGVKAEWLLATQDGFGESEADEPLPTQHILYLQPATTYHLRLLASSEDGEEQAIALTFTTAPATAPLLAPHATTEIGSSSATLHASLDPQGGNTNQIHADETPGVEVLPINWELQYREAGAYPEPGEGWASAGSGEITGAEAQ